MKELLHLENETRKIYCSLKIVYFFVEGNNNDLKNVRIELFALLIIRDTLALV